MLKIHPNSHLDHGLTGRQIEFLLQTFAHMNKFFIETVLLPEELGMISCGIHGPNVGDAPVPESEVFYAVRGNRKGKSRMCKRLPRMVREMTVIAGPRDNGPCMLYTAFGGPPAPREPWDKSMRYDLVALAESRKFWAQHALSV